VVSQWVVTNFYIDISVTYWSTHTGYWYVRLFAGFSRFCVLANIDKIIHFRCWNSRDIKIFIFSNVRVQVIMQNNHYQFHFITLFTKLYEIDIFRKNFAVIAIGYSDNNCRSSTIISGTLWFTWNPNWDYSRLLSQIFYSSFSNPFKLMVLFQKMLYLVFCIEIWYCTVLRYDIRLLLLFCIYHWTDRSNIYIRYTSVEPSRARQRG